MKTYDVIVIGSGGGAKIARGLAQMGRRVALVEQDQAGGTCLNRGCIPSKMLIYPASLAEKIRLLHKFHMDAEHRRIDFGALVKSINDYTDSVSDQQRQDWHGMPHLDYLTGTARFRAEREVIVGAEVLAAERIVIATGSRPFIPDIPGLAATPFMTSAAALRNRTLPQRLAVLGGGYIAAELGGAYAALGSDVTFLLRRTFLRREDADIVAEFDAHFTPGKTVYTHTQIDAVRHQDGIFQLACRHVSGDEFHVESDALLVATGVRPNTDSLGLAHTGIEVNADGFIAVDDYLQTTVPGVYALGDVAGNFLFRHSVNFEAEYWLQANVCSTQPFPIDYPPMPSAVFTHPEIASVGLTESAARRMGHELVVAQVPYTSCAMAVARGVDHGLVKLLFDRAAARLLGAHIVGEEAASLIQELVLAMSHRLTVQDLYRQVYIHPAYPEVVRNAVRKALIQFEPGRSVLF